MLFGHKENGQNVQTIIYLSAISVKIMNVFQINQTHLSKVDFIVLNITLHHAFLALINTILIGLKPENIGSVKDYMNIKQDVYNKMQNCIASNDYN